MVRASSNRAKARSCKGDMMRRRESEKVLEAVKSVWHMAIDKSRINEMEIMV